MDDFSDDILVAASQRGDTSAYVLFVKRHYRGVFRCVLRYEGKIDFGFGMPCSVFVLAVAGAGRDGLLVG